MKNKSSRHKDANTFKFQPFAERISNINVDIFHRVAHEYETLVDEEDECCFHQAVGKWDVLNLTESYTRFKKDVKAYQIITLPQLLHEKDDVIEVLVKHLRNKDVLCLQPLLEITVAVAKDLRNDFYPYYPQILEILIELLNTHDTDQLEWTFHCLAYMFKFLWRALIKDINTVFKTVLPLLSENFPEYINNFAAESFAFVARKVKDRPSFLELVLKAVKRSKDGQSGCGKLLFEVLKGVKGQFHSCADTMLPFLLGSLSNDKLPQDELFEILEHLITNIVTNIDPEKAELLWNTFYAILTELITKWEQKSGEHIENNLNLLLTLIGQTLEHKHGRLLQKPGPLIELLTKTLHLKNVQENVLLNGSKLSILLLLSKNIRLTQEQASSITRLILGLGNEAVLLYFVENVSKYISFEVLILPTFLKQCAENELKLEYLKVLSKLITQKSALCEDGIKLSQWTKYKIDFGKNNERMSGKLNEYVQWKGDYNEIDHFICGIVCVPHLNTKPTNFKVMFKKTFNAICDELREDTDEKSLKKKLFLLHIVFESLVHICEAGELLDLKENIMKVVLPLCNSVDYIASLKIIDLYFSATASPEVLDEATLEQLHAVLEKNFSSQYRQVRLLTSHIYTLFETTIKFDTCETNEDWNIFSICYHVESLVAQVDTYREQLQYLEKFTYDKPQITMCKSSKFKNIPLRYLCGVLYVNFQLLWEPVANIIASNAHGMDLNVFWEIYSEQLKVATCNSRNTPEVTEVRLECEFELVGDLYNSLYKVEDKPDFANFRWQLWKAMAQFPSVAESKTRDTSGFLLSFIEEEYMKTNSDMANMWNIKQNAEVTVDESMEVDDEEEESETEKIKNELKKAVPKTNSKQNVKLLLQHLLVFSKIRSPKSMYKEQDLYKLYFEFLTHKNPQIQKAAMDCIMTYKFKYLVPYQQNIYGLIDNKNFKNEIVAFRIDKESSVVQPEHRDELLPIVMRIVFSKMVAKTGLRTGGKSSGQYRRNLILRFLSGCRENEMMSFLHMAFRYYSKYLNDDVEIMIEDIVASVELDKFVPPKRLQSTINLLTVVLEQFGNLMATELLQFLLKVLLCIGAFLKGAFKNYDNIHAGYLPILRSLRTSSILILERFFNHFEDYPWSSKEVNAIFEIFMWPYLEKLNIEGIHSPTTLLKLICLWGTNPRYFPLLVKHEKNDTNMYPLKHLMMLLLNPKSHISVCNLIMDSVEKLVTLTVNAEESELPLQVDDVLPIQKNILERLKVTSNINYGSCILLPHVPSVLERIRLRLQIKGKNITKTELFILSRISELVWEADTSDTILQLLFPIVLKKCIIGAGDEVISQLTTTMYNLLRNVKSPEKHLKSISPLFAYISHPPTRKILISLLTTISEQNTEHKLTASIVSEMNAYDSKWVDQPDFQIRLDAFKKITEFSGSHELTIELGALIVYNCYYMISIERDLSLRENASHCLKSITPILINKCKSTNKELNYVLDEILLNLIRNSFRSRNNDIRNECISLLGHLARECPDAHVVLRDLSKLTNKTDLEVDFFENLTHLQTHRHSRALIKFTQIYKQETVAPNTRTLIQFLLPLTSHYLCMEKYMTKHSLVDASIEAIGTICRLLPWHQYESILKLYLGKLKYKVEYQRQMVKLIVHILDAFHFDLSKGHVDDALVNKKNARKAWNVTKEEVKEEILEEKTEVEEKPEVEEKDDIDEFSIICEGEALEEEDDEKTDKPQLPYEKITVLCKSSATRITKIIQTNLLPQLHRSLAEMRILEGSHKLNKKHTRAEKEEEDLLRIPISLAVVKLLQRLPKLILDNNLPGVFMKICTFLKSQLESVRRTARDTLQKIMITLGPDYLNVMLGEMVTFLSRGFQVHVLVYTIHAVLTSLKDMYKPTDIDKVLLTIIEICTRDLFGALADEKQVIKIVSKTSEAKSSKSCDTFQILAQFITDKCLMELILPIKSILATTHSFKTVNRAQECLRHIALGLVDNTFVRIESLLKFAYGTASESIPQLLNKPKPALSEKERDKLERQKPDCFIIAKQPVSRTGYRLNNVRCNAKTNAHLLVEFGIRLCSFMLKRDKLRDDDYRPYMDPFVEVFKNSLTSQHVKLSTVTLQCLQWVLKYDLPAMRENVDEISKQLFGILHKYASAGLSKGDNFDLVVAAFKTMAVLVRDVKYHTIDTDQLKVLLLYVEQDLHDYEKQAIAFGLLKAIINRKLIVPEVHSIMFKVAELSITSELTHVRLQSRVVFHQYLMEYPLGKKLETHVNFYIAQLSYEIQSGRESALDMIQSLIHSFPMNILKEFSGQFFVALGARLVNDDVPSCRKMVAECISSMITKLSKPDRNPLFDIVLVWLKDKKVAHKRLAAQICGIFITAEKNSFESRIPALMPVILLQFGLSNGPGKFVRLRKEEETTEEKERLKDHHLYQVLQMVLKLCVQCPTFLKKTSDIENLSVHVQSLLAYPHDWVRLAAAQFLGFVLSSVDTEKLSDLVISNTKLEEGFLYSDPLNGVKSLTLDLCAQLQPDIKADLAEQVIKNLVFMVRVLHKVPMDKSEDGLHINLLWIIKRMRKIVNNEVVENASSIVLRTEVFKWIAAVVTIVDVETMKPLLHHLLAPLVREMITTEESNAPLRQLSKEVATLVKKLIGLEEYTDILNRLQQHLSVKRAERKRSRTQLAVTDPEAYAKKKIKLNEKKKEAKKKKIGKRKGIVMKKKVVNFENGT